VHAYQFNGKRYRKALGSTVVLNVGSARLEVGQRQRKLEAGENPDLDDNDPRRAHLLTVREAVDRYWETHMSGQSLKHQANFAMFMAPWHKRKPKVESRRGHNSRKYYAEFGSMFSDRPFSSLKPVDIERFQRQFRSSHSHNGALRYVSALFNWAIRMQLVDMRNPCTPIAAKKIMRRRRDYTTEDIKRIAEHIFCPAIEVTPETSDLSGFAKRDLALVKARVVVANDQMLELCNLMGILLLTMARPSDLATAKFEHFDLDKLIWHKHNTKGIKLSRATYEYAFRSVPIHPKVAELVRAQRQRWPESELLFPSRTDMTQPRDSFRRGLERFKALPGIPAHFQLYDLKRIAVSSAASPKPAKESRSPPPGLPGSNANPALPNAPAAPAPATAAAENGPSRTSGSLGMPITVGKSAVSRYPSICPSQADDGLDAGVKAPLAALAGRRRP
jgi:integrase